MTGRALDGSIATIRIVPKDSPAANPAFDVTPARLVSGLITERGLCAANSYELAKLFQREAA
jgi:methylthioribose-1-phosphate isomerase